MFISFLKPFCRKLVCYLIISITIFYFQICKFKVGSFNYPMSKITFLSQVSFILVPDFIIKMLSELKSVPFLQFTPNEDSIKSILDYKITFAALDPKDTHYMAIGRYEILIFLLTFNIAILSHILTFLIIQVTRKDYKIRFLMSLCQCQRYIIFSLFKIFPCSWSCCHFMTWVNEIFIFHELIYFDRDWIIAEVINN